MKRLCLLLIAFVVCFSSCNLAEKDILRQIYVVYTGQDPNTHKDINFVSHSYSGYYSRIQDFICWSRLLCGRNSFIT